MADTSQFTIGAEASTSGGIRLTIAKQQVQELPPVDIDHPGPGHRRD